MIKAIQMLQSLPAETTSIEASLKQRKMLTAYKLDNYNSAILAARTCVTPTPANSPKRKNNNV